MQLFKAPRRYDLRRGGTVVVFEGEGYEFAVGHEAFVAGLDQRPVSGEQPYAQALFDGWPEGVAIGAQVVFDYLFVADAIGFQQGHARDACAVFACRAMKECADAFFGIAAQRRDDLVELAAGVRVGDDIAIECREVGHHLE